VRLFGEGSAKTGALRQGGSFGSIHASMANAMPRAIGAIRLSRPDVLLEPICRFLGDPFFVRDHVLTHTAGIGRVHERIR
jgi:hypothetical protein